VSEEGRLLTSLLTHGVLSTKLLRGGGSKASEGLGIKNDKFSRRMLRSLVQNFVPGDTGIFVVTSYLNYRRNHKRAPINVPKGQPGTSPRPIASTYERDVLCTHVVFFYF